MNTCYSEICENGQSIPKVPVGSPSELCASQKSTSIARYASPSDSEIEFQLEQ
ncbi:hypothetical protein DPMN_148679 [Dreissena polymorpha]|uniref:Uncharacterized protein n=1 Tax=Dreissena polymorpha TaxID=45954 RepID=A0A9D4FBC2_DREPO|nr:hypothetical protein DPMN_148679 [Dreissena polymorpha]